MNLQFNINYRTVYGEDVILNIIEDNESVSKYRMTTNDGLQWTISLNRLFDCGSVVNYFYSVERDGREVRHEWKVQSHRLEINSETRSYYVIYDRWIDVPDDAYMYTSAFTECLNRRIISNIPEMKAVSALRLKVRAPQLRSNEYLAVVGNDALFGSWDCQKSLRMFEHTHNEWIVDIDTTKLKFPVLEFKFVAVNMSNPHDCMWENGNNRTIVLPEMGRGENIIYEFTQAHFGKNNQKCAGTLVPVFSLKSDDSFGVGDFGDLKKMIDWVSYTHQRVLQILPINDTTITHTWTDSYPYSCISVFALHPQYADLNSLPAIKDAKKKKHFDKIRKELNALTQIDYERVNAAKIDYLKELYAQEGKNVFASDEFKQFFEETQKWLVPYAQYCYYRDTFGTADFTKWKGHLCFSEADRVGLAYPNGKDFATVAFYYYVQFVLNTQMVDAHRYAQKKGVILKGDIPIGVNRYGCDVWTEPRYFNLNGQAGAPPDDFSVNGQNWGFPTYNWDEMIKDGCAWWERRFTNMGKFFDAYRIDHVLGFFRIWEIPINSVHGLLGQFSPSLGMTREEIEGYGLHFQEQFFTEPFISDWIINEMFGKWADKVRSEYLVHSHDDIYVLKTDYNSQRKIEKAFEGKESADDVWIRDGLYSLVSNVLFLRDNKDPNKFHPRISAQFSYIYRALYDCDKYVFNKLYNDYFYRRNNQFWYVEAMKKLPRLVEATRMLVCAEDLGMVPDCVPWVMDQLRILSLEVQSMPKNPRLKFGNLAENPYRSVATISSHDMPTLRQWWDEDVQRSQEYFNAVLYKGGAAPHPMPGWLAEDIVSRHVCSNSMLCILSIQDWMAIDEDFRNADKDAERINIPANPKHYWRYRMHVSIEELMKNDKFNGKLIDVIRQGDRY